MLHRKRQFGALNSQDGALIERIKRKRIALAPGADIITEGRRSQGLYTVCDGWALRYQRLRTGSRQILDVLLPGDTVALASVLLGPSRHAAQAVTFANVCMLNGRQVVTLLKTDPRFALGLLRSRLEEERRADARLTMLGRMGAEERIGYFMMDIYERLRGRGLASATGCPFPLRRVDLADAVGLSKVHVMRALRELRARSVMEIKGRELIIPDVAQLVAFAGYGTV
jgi:CRP-like cAMP-binding protein